MKRILFLGLLALSLLVGCAGDPPDAAVVAVEATAAPTLVATTDPPTNIPEPTPTLEPTATQEQTATASPTDIPTSTPKPTATPEPTDTPEPTATATATLVPTVAPTALPTVPAVDTVTLLRQQLNDVIAELGNYRWILNESFGRGLIWTNSSADVDCRSVVDSHERILTILSLDMNGVDPTVQNAYLTALQGVTEFAAAADVWTDSCRQAMAMGNATNSLDLHQYNQMMVELSKPEAYWNQAIHMLE